MSFCIYIHKWAWLQEAEDGKLFPKGSDDKCFQLVGYTVSITSTQLCCCSMKAAIDNMWTNSHRSILINLYLKYRQL